MRTHQEVEARIRYLLVQELDARVRLASQRLPHVCTHNYRHPLDVRKTVDGNTNPNYNQITTKHRLPVVQTIGLCLLLGVDGTPLTKPDPENWGGTICEDPVDAQRCQYFTPTVTKDTLFTDFRGQLNSFEWVQENMPEVAGLLWAINSSKVPTVPWWKRILYRLLRIDVEPVRIIEDPSHLLGD